MGVLHLLARTNLDQHLRGRLVEMPKDPLVGLDLRVVLQRLVKRAENPYQDRVPVHHMNLNPALAQDPDQVHKHGNQDLNRALPLTRDPARAPPKLHLLNQSPVHAQHPPKTPQNQDPAPAL